VHTWNPWKKRWDKKSTLGAINVVATSMQITILT